MASWLLKPQEVYKTLNEEMVKPYRFSSEHVNVPGNSSTVLTHKSIRRLRVHSGHSDTQCLHSLVDRASNLKRHMLTDGTDPHISASLTELNM